MAKDTYYSSEGFARKPGLRGIKDRSRRRGNYYASHYKSIKKSRPMNFSRIENGFIIRMEYYGNTTKVTKNAIYLVIEPDYTPPRFKTATNSRLNKKKSDDSSIIETYNSYGSRLRSGEQKRYMHVFDLSYVPPAQVRKLVQFTKEVRVSNFVFSRSKFAFLDFIYKKRALYDALLPIMRDSYRTLIRDKINIKNVSIIDYDFKEKAGSPKITFIRPNLNNPQLKLEVQKISRELDVNPQKITKALRAGNMVEFDITNWSRLNRTDTRIDMGAEWFYDMIYEPNVNKETVVKEIEKMMPNIFKDSRKYAPVVLTYKQEYYLLYGEKLMHVCRVLGILPTVYMVKI